MMLSYGCVVMAAGNASRFGANKLLQDFQGKPLIAHALDVIPISLFRRVTVVSQYDAILEMARQRGFTAIKNDHPELGQSLSLQLGLATMQDCDAVLFQVADQPLLREESIRQLLTLSEENPECIVGLSHAGQRGNPCLFPKRFFPELADIRGDRGGNVVIQKHPDDLRLLEVDAEELQDVDTPEILNALK